VGGAATDAVDAALSGFSAAEGAAATGAAAGFCAITTGFVAAGACSGAAGLGCAA
jgi:hypothetical protein